MSQRPTPESFENPGSRLVEARPGFREFPREEIEQSLPAAFERQAREHPERLALRTRAASLSYGELNLQANRVARAILERRGALEEPAALLLSQEAPLVAAILGTLKAGKLYVPLDPAHPRAALAAAFEQAAPGILLTDRENRALAQELAGPQRLVLDAEAEARTGSDGLSHAVSPESGAYIFYTSGSTGRPKGVADTHRNVLHNVRRYTNSLKIGPGDRLSLIQSCTFSGTVSTLFSALTNGAAVLLFDLRREGPSRLSQWLASERATIYHSVPAIFRTLFEEGRHFPDLRLVRLEGDQAFRLDFDLYRQKLEPGCVLVNGLGATETGLTRQYFLDRKSRFEGARIPVGYAVEDMQVVLLDEAGGLAPAGAVGEIAVRSRFLARGYWNRPDLDRAAFLPGPPGTGERTYRTGDLGRLGRDGCLELLGRKDFRVKVRGQTVDPADVERALLQMDGIREAVVTAREDPRGEPRLIAYLVGSGGRLAPASSIRRELAAILPSAMVPASLVALEALPIDDNGKVNRRALPVPELDRERSAVRDPARSRLERRLTRIWERTLGVRRIGVREDFFELGGDSLSAAVAAARIERALGRPFRAALLLAQPTIEKLAAAIERDTARLEGGDPLVAIQESGSKAPLFLVPDRMGEISLLDGLAEHLGEDQPLYVYRWTGGSPPRPAPATLEGMAADAIRAIARVQPRGPYRLGGLCFGAVAALEMARQLRSAGESVELLVFIGISPFDFPDLTAPEALDRHRRPGGQSGLAHRVALHRHRLSGLTFVRKLAYVSGRSRWIPRFLWIRASRALTDAAARASDLAWRAARGFGEISGRPLPALPRDADRVSRRLFDAYRPNPDPGSVALFLSGKSRQAYSDDPARDFRGLSTGELSVDEVDCHDGWMLVQPHVADLARLLRRRLP